MDALYHNMSKERGKDDGLTPELDYVAMANTISSTAKHITPRLTARCPLTRAQIQTHFHNTAACYTIHSPSSFFTTVLKVG
jgi:hypothetical protein